MTIHFRPIFFRFPKSEYDRPLETCALNHEVENSDTLGAFIA